MPICDFWAWEKVALTKYLAYAFFGLFTSLLQFFAYFGQKIAVCNEINNPKIVLAKYKYISNEQNYPQKRISQIFLERFEISQYYEIRIRRGPPNTDMKKDQLNMLPLDNGRFRA